MLLLSVYFGLFAISLLSADCETGKKCTITSQESFLLKALQFDGFLSSMLKHLANDAIIFMQKKLQRGALFPMRKLKKRPS